jgi:DNA-binding NarL/FixJ family response regulator
VPKTDLSPHQLRVLQRLADGRTVKGIALDFGRTEAAIADAKRTVFRKLGKRTSGGAVAEGFRRGLLK